MNPGPGTTVRVIDALRSRPGTLRAVFFGALALFVLFDVFAPRHGLHFVGDRIRGFWALFGLVGCVAMAKFMKGLGAMLLIKPLDYYDPEKD